MFIVLFPSYPFLSDFSSLSELFRAVASPSAPTAQLLNEASSLYLKFHVAVKVAFQCPFMCAVLPLQHY